MLGRSIFIAPLIPFLFDVQRKFAKSSPVHMRRPKYRQEVNLCQLVRLSIRTDELTIIHLSLRTDGLSTVRPSVKDGRAWYHSLVHKGQGRLLRLRRMEERTVTSQAQPL